MNLCGHLGKLGRFRSPLQSRAASGSPGSKEPSASRRTGATPYLLAPAGQRPHRVGQVLDPSAVHRQSLLPAGGAGGAGTEADEVGVMVLLNEPSQSHVGGKAFKTALLSAAAWLRKLKHSHPSAIKKYETGKPAT